MTLFFPPAQDASAHSVKPSKYKNVKTNLDGLSFSSKREARRYADLTLLVRAGEIDSLELQPRFPMKVNGQKVCTYVADFRYRCVITGKSVIEDVKSPASRTSVYLLKRKLMRAVLGLEIVEIA